jgi:23S rRNA pseudouridine2605 synthase
MEERLQKIMAQAGLGSRRACEELIRQSRVQVDGQIATLGQKVDPARQRIVVDGQPLVPSEPLVYVALHKPRGVLAVSHDDRGRRTVRDLVPLPGHLYPVGRLDALSEGLILLTNDGRLANRLTHPASTSTVAAPPPRASPACARKKAPPGCASSCARGASGRSAASPCPWVTPSCG